MILKEFAEAVWYGKWSCGWEMWEGKPKLGAFRVFWDGQYHYCLHIGPLWVEGEY
jgi:hypothetical protein